MYENDTQATMVACVFKCIHIFRMGGMLWPRYYKAKILTTPTFFLDYSFMCLSNVKGENNKLYLDKKNSS